MLMVFWTCAQNTFHKIYFFDDSVAAIQDVYPTDSCYFFSGFIANLTTNRFESAFGKLSLDGTMEYFVNNTDLSSHQISIFTRTELVQDATNNFIQCFRNVDIKHKIRLIKYDKFGVKNMDTVYHDLWNQDSIYFFDMGKLIVDNNDSNFYMYFSYYDELTDIDTGSEIYDTGYNGVFFAKLDQDGNFIWQKRIKSTIPLPSNPSGFRNLNCTPYTDTTWLLSIEEERIFPSPSQENDWSKVHYYVYDENGNEIEHFITQDTQHGFGTWGLLKKDSLLIQSNFVSEWKTHPNGQMDWFYRPVITCRTISDFEILWKDTLIPIYDELNDYETPQELIAISDTSFVGVYTYYAPNFVPPNQMVMFPLKFFNKDLRTGKDIWYRYMRYFPEDGWKRYKHQMFDIEQTPDGGYVMSGQIISQDSLDAGRPGQYGYVIKTNCLGYFGDPQAAASYSIDGNNVIFTNESVQAGSYSWNFGDGIEMITGEQELTITHQFSESDTFEIQLIAYGCDGAADTLTFSIDFQYEENMAGPIYVGDSTLLTLFPNPVASGNSLSVYIGHLEDGENYLEVRNAVGELVDRFRIDAANTTYLYPARYASGMYFFKLIHDGQGVEVEKVMVED